MQLLAVKAGTVSELTSMIKRNTMQQPHFTTGSLTSIKLYSSTTSDAQ
jgi:hypothetical protein